MTNGIKPFIALLEKVISTYVQAFITFLLMSGSLALVNVSTAQAAAIAAIPAAVTVIANGLPVIPVGLPFYVDLILRTIRTFAAGFFGYLGALPMFTLEKSMLVAAIAGALPAALAVLKGGLASKVGRADSAALLPKSLDLPQAAAA